MKKHSVKTVTSKAPSDAYKFLAKNYSMMYRVNSKHDVNIEYIGFDISELSAEKPVAEITLMCGEPVQVINKREPRPIMPSDYGFKFGD